MHAARSADTLVLVTHPPAADLEPKFRAQLIDEATVVERGEQVKVWFVPLNDAWVRAKDHPLAVVDGDSGENNASFCPPGTIWQRTIELTLPAKTPLLCRVTRPLVESWATVDYFTKDRRAMRRHVEERWYRLIGNYRMGRCDEPQSFAEARQLHERNQGKPVAK